ncbi:MAG TPA: helix-turn-helix domain-containing protein [Acidimicrobiia bacterium]|jgi:hypothetical protein|nr:helix-turn-helix domain-containing protein [Acidimicrobiia bacterium]
MTDAADHPVFAAIQPLLDVIGGSVIESAELQAGDVPISWEGEEIGGVRLESLSNALDRLVTHIEDELGGRLMDLPRQRKQAAIRMLDERGAFQLRKAIEDIAAMMGVSRITIYNYLNAIRGD